MLYVDIPTNNELKSLIGERADGSVSIYLPTTPMTQQTDANRIEFANLAKQAMAQLEAADFDKHGLTAIEEHLTHIGEDDEFWRYQANGLAVLVTPNKVRTFRLPTKLTPTVQVSDRFHIKPLVRAVSFPHEAFVLALAENDVRLVQVFRDMPATALDVPGLPKSASEATGHASVNSRSASGRLQGAEGQKVLLAQFTRRVDQALRSVLAGRDTPLILAATQPLSSIYRAICTYPHLLESGIDKSPAHLSEADIAEAAIPIIDEHHADRLAEFQRLFDARKSTGRTVEAIAEAARAATYGAIEQLLVDIDEVVPGTIDDDGNVTFADREGAQSYGIVDEIAGRAILNGAKVFGVRKQDLPGQAPLAGVLRYSV